jgi:hypothetical protein
MTAKRKGGRPRRHPGERLSQTRSFRVRGGLDDNLQAAARTSGRSVSEEIEHRLEISFLDERRNAHMLGSDVGAEVLRMVRAAMVIEGVAPDWTGDLVRAENFRTTVNAVIASLLGLKIELPPPEKRQEGLRLAKYLLLRSSVRRDLPNEIMFSDLEPLPSELPADDGR